MITRTYEAVSKRRLVCALVHTVCSPRRVLVLVERRSCNKILFNDYIGPRGVSKRSLGCALVHAMCSPRRVLVLVKRWSCDRETAIQDHAFFHTKG